MIELRDISKYYNGVAAVKDLRLEVSTGELLVLLGTSGCGKTTTLKMINRLIDPSSGQILVDGKDIADEAPHVLRRKIGYVFQRIGLFPHMTVAENISVTLTLMKQTTTEIRVRVNELADLVQLDEKLLGRFPHELSGGQQQRVAVARALAAKPGILLMDEPFGAIDPITRDGLQDSLLEIRKQLGLTVIFVTHDMAEALLLGDRIAVMSNGHLVQCETPAELMRNPASDYVNSLVSMPRRQAERIVKLTGKA